MAIPDFQTMMLPLLRLVSSGEERTMTDVTEALAREFSMTPEEIAEPLPSGRQSRFKNRVGWAKTYLLKTRLIESTGRARFRITKRGQQVLASKPVIINLKFLDKFPELAEFRKDTKEEPVTESGASAEVQTAETPEERLEAAHRVLRGKLAQDLLERMKTCSPGFFEQLVVDVLVAMGYGGSRQDAASIVGKSGDGGVDGIIKEDKLGLDVVYVQAKRWESTVGSEVVQRFAGSLEGFRARKGVLITTSNFSKSALDYVGRIEKKIVLVDGRHLAEMMIDHGVGVADVASYTVKKIDLDYFGEDS